VLRGRGLIRRSCVKGARDERLKNEDEPLLCVAPNAGQLLPPSSDSQLSSPFSFSLLCMFPFTVALAAAVVLVLAARAKGELR
jgi:hypothetical protein